MATTKTPRAKKTTVHDIPFVETPHAVEESTLFEQLSAQIPDDWRRRSIAFVAGLVTSFASGYMIGVLTEYAIVGALTLTGSAFMALLILLLGLIMVMYIGSKSSMFVYVNVMNKSVDRAFGSVRGWFTPTQGATA